MNLIESDFFENDISDCGGDLFESSGGLASPNWPESYASNEDCTWNIQVAPFKVNNYAVVSECHFEQS